VRGGRTLKAKRRTPCIVQDVDLQCHCQLSFRVKDVIQCVML
jgi:hypothetical protein